MFWVKLWINIYILFEKERSYKSLDILSIFSDQTAISSDYCDLLKNTIPENQKRYTFYIKLLRQITNKPIEKDKIFLEKLLPTIRSRQLE